MRSRFRIGKRKMIRRRRQLSRFIYLAEKERARGIVHALVARFASRYGVSPKRISIRNAVSRWGSASSLGNLNFSVRIVFLPKELQEYIVVHELCHLLEHNHSTNFWALVEREVPGHKTLRRRLRGWEREDQKKR